MKLLDLPLEDLADGLFPHGAKVSGRFDDPYEPNVRKGVLAEMEIARRYTGGRLGGGLLGVSLVLDVGISMVMKKTSSILVSELRMRHQSHTVTFSDERPFDPFKIILPRWLSFETLYDQLDVESNLLEEARLDIHMEDVEPVLRIRRWDTSMRAEVFALRIHLP